MQQLFVQITNYVWYFLHVSVLHYHPQGAEDGNVMPKHVGATIHN
jgi:hypothetical protein